MSKRFFGAKSFSILLTAFVLVGCGSPLDIGSKGPTEVKVSFWGTPEEIGIITDALAPWQEQHPEIKIVFEHTPYTGYISKVLTRIAGGAAPDWHGLASRDRVRRRRAARALSYRLPGRPALRFLYAYVGRGGFLDGRPGFRFCRAMAWYEAAIDAELRRRGAASRGEPCASR